MQRIAQAAVCWFFLCQIAPCRGEDRPRQNDWPWWRGPTRNGIAAPNQKPPVRWSESNNILWKSPVPGRGHGSPVISENRVFLATAETDSQTQSVLCFDRQTGRQLWQSRIHKGGLDKNLNEKNTLASSTPACDGERVVTNFLNAGAIYTTAVDYSGKRLWQTKISECVLHEGYSSSPAIYQSLVFVTADSEAGGALAGLDRATGKIQWTTKRPALPNYASPVILRAADREQLLVQGCDLVTSLDPLSGKKFWEIAGATTECVGSMVTDGNLVFTSGGYPRQHLAAVRADGSGKVVWEHKLRIYVPSMIVHAGCLYAIVDGAGIAMCWACDTGKELWKARLGGTFSASLVLAGNHLYAVNETGKAFIFKADPRAFTLVAENKLGDECLATPAICGNHIYLRVAETRDNRRQEWLYCVAEK
jgi:outer membrane protein assembly factor BamB